MHVAKPGKACSLHDHACLPLSQLLMDTKVEADMLRTPFLVVTSFPLHNRLCFTWADLGIMTISLGHAASRFNPHQCWHLDHVHTIAGG